MARSAHNRRTGGNKPRTPRRSAAVKSQTTGSTLSEWGKLKRRLRWASVLGLVAGSVYTGFVWDPPPTNALATPAVASTAPVDPVLRPLRPAAVAVRGLSATLNPEDNEPAAATAQDGAPTSGAERGYAIPAGQVNLAAAKPQSGAMVQQLADGTRLEFTVSPGLQHDAREALAKYRAQYGALVVLDPKTGDILAMADRDTAPHPASGISLKAEGPAASVFKIVTSAALIDHGALKPSDSICTHGGARRLNAKHLSDDKRRDRNCQTFAEAHGASNNVAFARWADRLLEPEQLRSTAEKFMFNQRIPFLRRIGVSDANVPRGSRLGFAKTAAGFTGTTMSPMHGALIASTVANGGTMMTPRLVKRAYAQDGTVLYNTEHLPLSQVMSSTTAQAVTELMKATTVGEGSAAKYFLKRGKYPRIKGVEIAGKTGTLSKGQRHFSWFVGFAPADDPQIAVAALVVNGKVWTTKGAVVAREFMQRYFKRQRRAAAKAERAAAKAAKGKKKR